MKLVAALLVLAIAVTGCQKEEPPADQRLAGTCGLPNVRKYPDIDQVSKEFLLEDGELARVQDRKGRFIATIYAPLEVNDAYRLYQEQVKDADWKVISQETEGFEAEIYLSNPKHLAAIQIRSSTCKEKIIVFVSIVDRDDLPTS